MFFFSVEDVISHDLCLSLCSSGKQMDPWVWSRVPTSLQSESSRVKGWSHCWAPLECKPLQLWATFAGREKEAAGKLMHKQGQREPGKLASVIGALKPQGSWSVQWTLLQWTWWRRRRQRRSGASGSQPPKGEMLFLASSCRWIEAFAFAHCAGFSTLCKAVYLLPALYRDLIQPCSYTGLTQGSAFTNQTLFWNINSKLIINTKSTEILSVSERIRFQEVKIWVTRD